MGTYYGHNSGAYNLLGLQGLIDENIAGCGPYELILSSGNTVITVMGTEVPYPLGFMHGEVLAPGWLFPYPPHTILGISPVFDAPSGSIIAGDTIRWFDASTNYVSQHTVVSAVGNKLTVTPAITNAVVQGSGFSIKPRASIIIDAAPTPLSFVFPGVFRLTGLHFESAIGPPLLSSVMTFTYLQQCLCHIDITSSAGANTYALAPNTFMDYNTGGAQRAGLFSNSSGVIQAFCQNFIGPSANFGGRGGGICTMCFSLWIKNNVGVSLTDGTSSKCDGAEFYLCGIGVSLNGSAKIVASLWFTKCGTGILCRNNSEVANSDIVEYGPSFPVVPLVINGQGSGVGIDSDFNCQVYTTNLRLRDLTTHALMDGLPVPITNVTGTPTLISGAGVGSYGSHLSGLVFINSDVNL